MNNCFLSTKVANTWGTFCFIFLLLLGRVSLSAACRLNRPFPGSGHMVRNKLHWDANNAVGLSKQRNSYQSSPTFLCFESPTASFASQCNLFRTMHVTRSCKGPILWKSTLPLHRQISYLNPQHLRHGSNQCRLYLPDRKIRIPPRSPIKRVLTPISDGLSKLYIQWTVHGNSREFA